MPLSLANEVKGKQQGGNKQQPESAEEKEIGDGLKLTTVAIAPNGKKGKNTTGHEQDRGYGGQLVDNRLMSNIQQFQGGEYDKTQPQEVGGCIEYMR